MSTLESGTTKPTDRESRQQAGTPSGDQQSNKNWSPIGRVDNAFSDHNLVFTCPPMEMRGNAAE